jgi:hypothetical protein
VDELADRLAEWVIGWNVPECLWRRHESEFVIAEEMGEDSS